MESCSFSRRLVIAVVVVAGLFAVPAPARAQAEGTVRRIGILGNEDTPPWAAFRQGMRDLGYVEGRNLEFESRWSEGYTERLPALATELVATHPEVIVASGTQAIRAAKQATTTIPIVMAVSAYPDKLGLVESLAQPGGNVTGLTNLAPELHAKRLELLKEIAPGVSRLALFWNPDSPVEPIGYQNLREAAKVLGIEIQSVEVRSPDAFDSAFARISAMGTDAIQAHANPINFKGRQRIADFALKIRKPSLFGLRLFVQAGGLMSYAPRFDDLFRRASIYVDKILKGAKPADLPVQQPEKFELVINLKTARRLGITVPRSIRLRADRVIE